MVVGLGLWAIRLFLRLGGKIDVILRENRTSVLAAEGMKEALGRMDSALLFAIGGDEEQARSQFHESRPKFAAQLGVERGNVALPASRSWPTRWRRLWFAI